MAVAFVDYECKSKSKKKHLILFALSCIKDGYCINVCEVICISDLKTITIMIYTEYTIYRIKTAVKSQASQPLSLSLITDL